MKKTPLSFGMRFKIILTFFITISLVTIFMSFFSYYNISYMLFKDLQSRIKHITQLSSDIIKKEPLERLVKLITPDLSGERITEIEHSADYKLISDQMNKIRDTAPGLIRYVYTIIPTEDVNTALFVVDADLLVDSELAKTESIDEDEISHFAEEMDISGFVVLRQALKEKRSLVEEEFYYDADLKIYSFSGYAPIRDDNGRFIALMGIDMGSEDVQAVLSYITLMFIIIAVAALVISLISAFILGTMFTRGIRHLDKIVNEFGKQEMGVRADVKSKDEVGRLGQSFNVMAETIQNYSNKLQALLKAFNHFVPHDFLNQLEKENILEVKLGDQVQKEMTVLFSDISAFTTISESMTPKENFNFINSFLSRMGPVIRQHRGFIVKYIGDGIMALFPHSVDDAVKAGIDMLGKLAEYNEHRKTMGYKPVDIGIGLHMGKLMLGTVGEEERMEGTVISDTVNVCSRLEGLTRKYNVHMIVSEDVMEGVLDSGDYLYRFLDKVQVKGKTKPVIIYDLFSADSKPLQEEKLKARDSYDNAIHNYLNRKFDVSRTVFLKLSQDHPDDKVYSLYLKRCEKFLTHDPGPGWNGVEAYDSK
ncbi:MAG: adenylate/guanylate cyclase domain-containing protein [Spirochaetales bacterium]|nr:adenylate/guanylate cyclase domain-containing protein [Spirochaetales bacterium]